MTQRDRTEDRHVVVGTNGRPGASGRATTGSRPGATASRRCRSGTRPRFLQVGERSAGGDEREPDEDDDAGAPAAAVTSDLAGAARAQNHAANGTTNGSACGFVVSASARRRGRERVPIH